MADDGEYVEKRKRNNESVKKCRENEKQKIKDAEEKSKKLKEENKLLSDKLSSMRKEVGVLKSLFESTSKESLSTIASLNNGAAAFLSLATTTEDDKKPKASTEEVDKKPLASVTAPKSSGTRGRKRKPVE